MTGKIKRLFFGLIMAGVAATGPRSLQSAHLALLEPLRIMANLANYTLFTTVLWLAQLIIKRILHLFKMRLDLLGTQFTFPTLRTVYFSSDDLLQRSSQDQNLFDGETVSLKRFAKCKALFTKVQEGTF